MRISREQMFMEMAVAASKRSTCFRRAVGAIVVINNRPVSLGYNGPPPGEEHCTLHTCPDNKSPCTRALHAESNGLNWVPHQLWDVPKRLFTTESPCMACASLIANRVVTDVYYANEYRLSHGIIHLIKNHVNVWRVTPSGYMARKLLEDNALVEVMYDCSQ